MEFFQNAKAVKLRSHLDKYLVADDDRKTVRQSRNGSSRKARWLVELIGDTQLIRLKSCHGTYLTASDMAFLFGMTGKRVTQTVQSSNNMKSEPSTEWEPKRDGFQVKLVTRGGKYLRANGGTPPWRNSITHDNPHAGGTKSWVLWDVEVVNIPESEDVMDYLSTMSSFSSVLSDDVYSLEPESPMSVMSSFSPCRFSPTPRKTGMDLFHNAKSVRLRGHHDKYLIAEEDEESLTQDRNGSTKAARWTVEFSDSPNIIRLKSCYNKYLTASNQPFLLGMTGRKALQTMPRKVDSSVEWEPIREGTQVKLKTRYGQFLRANGGLPPWRNSVTHDIPHRTATQDWILWDVDIVEIQVLHSPVAKSQAPTPSAPPEHSDSFSSDVSSPPEHSVSIKSAPFSRQESSDSTVISHPKTEGRTIHYHVAEEDAEDVDDATVGYALTFKGNGVEELTKKLEEETGMENIIVCTRSIITQKLYPLRLNLPPNSTNMRVVVVPSSSRVARDFAK